MTDSDSQRPQQAESTARLARYLRQQPEDLIDARRLMHHFHVSAEDFAHVLAQMEQPTAMSRLAQYLQQHPEDLIDACRLMRRFQVSAEDFTYVLAQIEQSSSSDD